MIKLFASDLDGTLYNSLHQTDRGILHRVRRVIRAGRHVALATGRWSATGAELGFGDLPIEVVSGNGPSSTGRTESCCAALRLTGM